MLLLYHKLLCHKLFFPYALPLAQPGSADIHLCILNNYDYNLLNIIGQVRSSESLVLSDSPLVQKLRARAAALLGLAPQHAEPPQLVPRAERC